MNAIVNLSSHPKFHMQIRVSKQGRIKSGFYKLFIPEIYCKKKPHWRYEKISWGCEFVTTKICYLPSPIMQISTHLSNYTYGLKKSEICQLAEKS